MLSDDLFLVVSSRTWLEESRSEVFVTVTPTTTVRTHLKKLTSLIKRPSKRPSELIWKSNVASEATVRTDLKKRSSLLKRRCELN